MSKVWKNRDLVDRGVQVGVTLSFKKGVEIYWSTVGIQLYEGVFKVYIDEINSEDMVSEVYSKDILKSFENLEDAISYLEFNSVVKFDQLQICKGQKKFNPKFEDSSLGENANYHMPD